VNERTRLEQAALDAHRAGMTWSDLWPTVAGDVADRLGMKRGDGDTCRMLCRAAQAGLVQRIGRSGWIPVCADSDKQ
jgi:hypothetical protein